VLSDVKDAETGQRGFLLTGDEHYLEPYQSGITAVFQKLTDLRDLTKDNPNQQRRLDTLEPLIQAKFDELKDTVDLRRDPTKGFDAALAVVKTDKGKKIMDQIRQVVADMENEEMSLLKVRSEEAQASAHAAAYTIVIGTVAAFVLSLLVGFLIAQNIASRLAEITVAAGRISKGDLRGEKLKSSSRDEIGQLAEVFNNMVESLKNLTGQILSVTGNVNSSAQEIMASTQQQASGTKEQAATVQEITSTMQELTQSGSEIGERAKQVAAAAEATSVASRSGVQAVQDTNRTMEAIREQVEEVAEKIVALSQKTQAVGEIVSTVNDIAEQSNLLALNAAIEAAAAGEQGSRFSVVANEMKHLADRAKECTVQVRTILGDIQKGINSSVMLTEEGVKRVEIGKQQADVTERTINEMNNTTLDSVKAFQQIIGASNQQQIGFEQVTQGMRDIRQAAEQTAAGTSQLEKAVSNLNALSHQLRGAVEQYQL
jgi:methyl-accepting chemotaxis protein